MTKVDPGLLHVVARRMELAADAGRTADALQDAAAPRRRSAPEVVHVGVRFTGPVDDLRAAGFTPLSLKENPAAGWSIGAGPIALDRLGDLDAVEHVVKIEGSAPLRPLLDKSLPQIHADDVHNAVPGRRGNGVVIGIIDGGIDWRHPDFIKPDGVTSRIIGIWDQKLDAEEPGEQGPGEQAPAAYPGIGVEYTKQQIQNALDETAIVRTTDGSGHGTHVAGIAAGNGRASTLFNDPFSYIGLAPEADIIVVVVKSAEPLAEAPNVIHAFDFIWDHPELVGRPVVINMSLGDHQGAHDGTSVLEEMIAVDLRGTRGMRGAVVIAAGNERWKAQHALVRVPGGTTVELPFNVPADLGMDLNVHLRYRRPAAIDIRVVPPPPGQATAVVVPGSSDRVELDGGQTIVRVATTSDLVNPDRVIDVDLDRADNGVALPAGPWGLRLTNPGSAEVLVDAWLTSNDEGLVFMDFIDTSGTLTIPGTCVDVITVGATKDVGTWVVSSLGPTRASSHNQKPDIVAPGVGITAAGAHAGSECLRSLCWARYVDKAGTSMAAPHVAGVAAAMFETNPQLTHAELKRRIMCAADRKGRPKTSRENSWGSGVVDAVAAVAAATTPPPCPDDPAPGPIPPGLPLTAEAAEAAEAAEPPPDGAGTAALLTGVVRRAVGTAEGEEWAALVSRHFSEVRALVNHHKRVALRWHRFQGPALLAHVVNITAGSPRGVVLPTIDLAALPRRLQDLLDALERYGSPDLAAAVRRHRDAIVAIDIPAVIRALGDAARAA